MKFDRYIFILILAASMLAATACSKDMPMLDEEPGGVVSPDDDGMVDVVLNVSIESSLANAMGTRADDGEADDGGDLKDIDLFIYVVRDKDNNILRQYGKGFVDFENVVPRKKTDENGEYTDKEYTDEEYIKQIKKNFAALQDYTLTADNNQTLMPVKWTKIYNGCDNMCNSGCDNMCNSECDDECDNANLINRYQMENTITLRVLRGTVFKFSCWAQSSKSTAYNFDYLTAVKVNYDKMEANSDINDAYCATAIFSIGQEDSPISITLNRPFAQINIGIDEEILDKEDTHGHESIPIRRSDTDDADDTNDTNDTNDDYRYSKFSITGLAKAFDVVKNKVWSSETIEQYYARDKEYANYSDSLFNYIRGKVVTDKTTYEVTDREGNKVDDTKLKESIESYVNATLDMPYSPLPGYTVNDKKEYVKDNGTEEWLTVFDFSGFGPELKDEEVSKLLKTYKKLAMAYVLVPDFESVASGNNGDENVDLGENGGEADDSGDNGGGTDAPSSSSIKFDTFYIAKDENGTGEITYSPTEKDESGKDVPVSISVKRNWRTNLLFTDWDWLK